MYKADFVNKVYGYDERYERYGNDDRDLYNRCMGLGLQKVDFGRSYKSKEFIMEEGYSRKNYRPIEGKEVPVDVLPENKLCTT